MARLLALYRNTTQQAQVSSRPELYSVARRPRSLMLWLAVIVLFTQSGCSVWDLARRTLRNEPDCYDVRPEEKEDLEAYRCWAIEAYQFANDGTGSSIFYDGFLAGFVDHVYSGGNGEPPVIPPCQFWGKKNIDSAAAIEEWNDGFRRGAASAKQGGYRDRVVVPISLGNGRPQRRNVSGECVAEDPNRQFKPDYESSIPDSNEPVPDFIESVEAPSAGYDRSSATEAEQEYPLDNLDTDDPIQWSELDSETTELDLEESRNDAGPSLGNPGSLSTPPKSPNPDDVLESLLPDSPSSPAVPENSPPQPSDSIDLDDLFSRNPGKAQPRPDAPNSADSANIGTGESRGLNRGSGTTSYNDWKYGDMIKASQSKQTSSMPGMVDRATWTRNTGQPEVRETPIDTIDATNIATSSKPGSIQFAQEKGVTSGVQPQAPNLASHSRDETSKPLPLWRMSEWREKFKGGGDYGPEADESDGVSIGEWDRLYGKKK